MYWFKAQKNGRRVVFGPIFFGYPANSGAHESPDAGNLAEIYGSASAHIGIGALQPGLCATPQRRFLGWRLGLSHIAQCLAFALRILSFCCLGVRSGFVYLVLSEPWSCQVYVIGSSLGIARSGFWVLRKPGPTS